MSDIVAGIDVKLRPTRPGGRDGTVVKVTRVYETANGTTFDYTDPRNGGCRSALLSRIARVVKPRAVRK